MSSLPASASKHATFKSKGLDIKLGEQKGIVFITVPSVCHQTTSCVLCNTSIPTAEQKSLPRIKS